MQYEVTSKWQPELQADILLYMAEMLAEGFTLMEIFPFLKAVYPKYADTFGQMQGELLGGKLFSDTLQHMHINQTIQYRVQTIEQFGDMAQGLKVIALYIKELNSHKKKIRQTLTYPLSLLVLIIGMMLVMRTFMLPQLQTLISGEAEGVVAVVLFVLDKFPQILLLSGLVGLGLGLLLFVWQRTTTPLQRAQSYVKIIIIGPLFRLYYAYFFAYEFSQLFQLGYSVKQIIAIFTHQQNVPFLLAFGNFLQRCYEDGTPFADSLAAAGVFTPEFSAIIRQGEMLNQLAVKMRLYSNRCLQQYYLRLGNLIKLAQNSLFVLVALTVVFVYLILMMPMLTMIGEI